MDAAICATCSSVCVRGFLAYGISFSTSQDPCGYIGISLELLGRLLKHPKSEVLIFFNTNRISPGLANPFVKEHIDALFGAKRADAVRVKVKDLHGLERENAVLDSFEEAMSESG